MNLIHIIDCYYWIRIQIQSAIDNEGCLWLWGSNANVNYGKIYSGRVIGGSALRLHLGLIVNPSLSFIANLTVLKHYYKQVGSQSINLNTLRTFNSFVQFERNVELVPGMTGIATTPVTDFFVASANIFNPKFSRDVGVATRCFCEILPLNFITQDHYT